MEPDRRVRICDIAEELIKNFITRKREECRQLSAIPHPAEFDRYFNL